LRINEAVHSLRDVHFDKGVLHVRITKNGKIDGCPERSLRKLLEEIRRRDPRICDRPVMGVFECQKSLTELVACRARRITHMTCGTFCYSLH